LQIIESGSENKKTFDLTNFSISGGTPGQTLATDGDGELSWVSAPPSQVLVDEAGSALRGNGLLGQEITLEVADATEIAAGTDDLLPITSAGLRTQLGADVSFLDTTQKTVIPALNEIYSIVSTLAAPLQFVGTYNAATNQVAPAEGGPAVAGNLPAADPANKGWVLITIVGGTGQGQASSLGAIGIGDWLVSNGNTWDLIDVDLSSVVAVNVSVSPIEGMEATNVQDAFEEIFSDAFRTVVVDEVTIMGTGLSGDPLVAQLDDGDY